MQWKFNTSLSKVLNNLIDGYNLFFIVKARTPYENLLSFSDLIDFGFICSHGIVLKSS